MHLVERYLVDFCGRHFILYVETSIRKLLAKHKSEHTCFIDFEQHNSPVAVTDESFCFNKKCYLFQDNKYIVDEEER